jgi:hypothetical protein
MHRRRLFLSLFALLLWSAALPAQSRRQGLHLLPGDLNDDSRIEMRPAPNQVLRFLRQLTVEEKKNELKEEVFKLLKNPTSFFKDAEYLKKLKELQTSLQGIEGIRPEDLKTLHEHLQKIMGKAGPQAFPPFQQLPSLPPETMRKLQKELSENKELQETLKRLAQSLQNLPKPTDPQDSPNQTGRGRPSGPQSTPTAPTGQSSAEMPTPVPADSGDMNPEAENWFEDWLLKQVKHLEKRRDLQDFISRSPAFQQALTDANQWLQGKNWANLPRSPLLRGMSKQLAILSRKVGPGGLLSDMRLPSLPRFLQPRAQRWNLPSLHVPWGGPRSLRLPNLGGPVSGTGRVNGVVWVVLALLLGQALWTLYGRYRKAQAERDAQAQMPTVWPVTPDSVHDRAELIRAFEYLSLNKLGLEASSHNHRLLAIELGGAEPQHQAAADQLADVYEQARYAPDEGPLPEAELAAARRCLNVLSGVTAS